MTCVACTRLVVLNMWRRNKNTLTVLGKWNKMPFYIYINIRHMRNHRTLNHLCNNLEVKERGSIYWYFMLENMQWKILWRVTFKDVYHCLFGTIEQSWKDRRESSLYSNWFHWMQDTHVPPLSVLYVHHVLTLSCRSGLAPDPRRSSTTFRWPLKLAMFRDVQPSCIIEWV